MPLPHHVRGSLRAVVAGPQRVLVSPQVEGSIVVENGQAPGASAGQIMCQKTQKLAC